MKTKQPYQLPQKMRETWLTSREAMEKLGVSRWTLARRIEEGVIDSSRYNGRTIVTIASVKRYLRQWGV